MARRLAALGDELVDAHDKALYGLDGVTLGAVGALSWNVARGDTPLPVLTMDWESTLSNIRLMQRYCDEHDCLLAPHGKTTMAPQIWAEQLRAGAWAITVANVGQLEVAASFGVPRILLANEVTAVVTSPPSQRSWPRARASSSHSSTAFAEWSFCPNA